MKKETIYLSVVIIIAIVLAGTVMFSTVQNNYTFSWKNIDFICSAKRDFEGSNEIIGSSTNDQWKYTINHNTYTEMYLKTTNQGSWSEHLSCELNNVNLNNVDTILIPIDGNINMQGKVNQRGTTSFVISDILKVSVELASGEIGNKRELLSDILIEKLTGENRWRISNGIHQGTGELNNVVFTLTTGGDTGGSATANNELFVKFLDNIEINCKEDYILKNNKCVKSGNMTINYIAGGILAIIVIGLIWFLGKKSKI